MDRVKCTTLRECDVSAFGVTLGSPRRETLAMFTNVLGLQLCCEGRDVSMSVSQILHCWHSSINFTVCFLSSLVHHVPRPTGLTLCKSVDSCLFPVRSILLDTLFSQCGWIPFILSGHSCEARSPTRRELRQGTVFNHFASRFFACRI